VPQSVADLALSESWQPTPPASGYAIGGFSVDPKTYSETLTQVTNTVCGSTQNCDYNTFYWTQTGTYTLTFNYVLLNGNSNSASVTFSVLGPTGNTMIQASTLTDGSGVQVFPVATNTKLGKTGITYGTHSVGITFTTNANPPSGTPSPGTNQSFIFVQLLDSLQYQYINSNGPFANPASPNNGLDNTYPYAYVAPTTTNDSPGTLLPSIYGEGWESFTATMYLMWDPALPSGCTAAKTVQNSDGTFTSTASTCTSIPVPLSSVTWHWSGCAINTLATQPNNTTWTRSVINGCPVETLSVPQTASFDQLQWTNVVKN
jgi:hypothetical protein